MSVVENVETAETSLLGLRRASLQRKEQKKRTEKTKSRPQALNTTGRAMLCPQNIEFSANFCKLT
ncbi:hypothetical protein U1Q18_011674, partial [Sarracenia purpurea var. burkii]